MPETKFTTSFIPKKPIETVGSGGRIKRRSIAGLFTFLTLIIFLVTCVGLALVFLYKQKLNADIVKNDQQLAEITKTIDEQFVTDAIRLNDRILGVKKLLDAHLSPSQIFFLLEEKTIQTVKFDSLNFSFNEDGDVLLKGNGVAADYESIIQQSDVYGKKGYLRDVIFSGLQNKEGGFISFTFESKVDPELILYLNALPDDDENISEDSDNTENDNESDEVEDLSGLINNPQ